MTDQHAPAFEGFAILAGQGHDRDAPRDGTRDVTRTVRAPFAHGARDVHPPDPDPDPDPTPSRPKVGDGGGEGGDVAAPADAGGEPPRERDRCPHGSPFAADGSTGCPERCERPGPDPAAVYCLTPTSEATARAVADLAQPAPVSRWELPTPDRDDEEDV